MMEGTGLERDGAGALRLEGVDLPGLAREHGTPLFILAPARAAAAAAALRDSFGRRGLAPAVHFACKANPLLCLLARLAAEGLGIAVSCEAELELARRAGFPPGRVLLGGPAKSRAYIQAGLASGAGAAVVEDARDLDLLRELLPRSGASPQIGVRVRPGLKPRGMNPTSHTGRSGHMGFDLASGEAEAAVLAAAALPGRGPLFLHAHIGSGVREVEVFRRLAACLAGLCGRLARRGLAVEALDLGGGLGLPGSRELGTFEWLLAAALDRAPAPHPQPAPDLADAYTEAVAGGLKAAFEAEGLPVPRLILEPGRAITGAAGVLLVGVVSVRGRDGGVPTAVCDAGALSGALMCLSEFHRVLLAGRAPEGPERRTHLVGPLPSPADVLYRGLPMPALRPGDVLAVADAGAYFLATEVGFGRPRAAVVCVEDGRAELARRRETVDDMVARDLV